MMAAGRSSCQKLALCVFVARFILKRQVGDGAARPRADHPRFAFDTCVLLSSSLSAVPAPFAQSPVPRLRTIVGALPRRPSPSPPLPPSRTHSDALACATSSPPLRRNSRHMRRLPPPPPLRARAPAPAFLAPIPSPPRSRAAARRATAFAPPPLLRASRRLRSARSRRGSVSRAPPSPPSPPTTTMLSGRELAGAAYRTSEAALAQLDARRVCAWLLLTVALLALRPFLPVMVATFILGYVANSVVFAVARVSRGRAPRRLVVGVFYAFIVTAISSFSLMTIPTVVRESQYFITTLQSENPYVYVANSLRKTLGDDLTTKLEAYVVYSIQMPEAAAKGTLPPASSSVPAAEQPPPEWTEQRSRRLGILLQKSIRSYIAATISLITKLLAASTKVVFKALFSLLFSFMIMWDLPVIAHGVRRLKTSRLSFAYDELAPAVVQFGTVLGKSFEAQGLIALINTTLTTAGLLVLSIPGVGFLSLVTLLCSFIPVAGVFISTIPMCVIALSEFGVAKALAVIAMVIIVHLVEAYVLNPQIYSAHLHLHPFMVLTVLYIAEHSYGIPGLLLAVPVAVYLVRSLGMDEARPVLHKSGMALASPDGGGDAA